MHLFGAFNSRWSHLESFVISLQQTSLHITNFLEHKLTVINCQSFKQKCLSLLQVPGCFSVPLRNMEHSKLSRNIFRPRHFSHPFTSFPWGEGCCSHNINTSLFPVCCSNSHAASLSSFPFLSHFLLNSDSYLNSLSLAQAEFRSLVYLPFISPCLVIFLLAAFAFHKAFCFSITFHSCSLFIHRYHLIYITQMIIDLCTLSSSFLFL